MSCRDDAAGARRSRWALRHRRGGRRSGRTHGHAGRSLARARLHARSVPIVRPLGRSGLDDCPPPAWGGRPVRRIVIVGGGYAGLHAFAQISRRLRGRIRSGEVTLTLVAKDPYHTYHGWTGEVISGRMSVRSTLTILPTLLRGQYVEGEVKSIDADRRVVELVTPDGVERQLPYDHVLVATGSRDPFKRLPGLAEYGWCLKNTRDMQRLLARLETFTGQRVAVVGGGMAGAVMASALRERFRRLGRGVSIELITSGDALFRQLQPRFSKLADQGTRILEEQGITIRWGSRVTSI